MALELARRFNGELICADSWTVYKDFDIGTAKPSSEEREAVPHHLLDIADPLVGFSAVEFQRQARQAIEVVTSHNALPIMVGGTGLYIDSVLFDYQFLPASSPELRQELDAMSLPALQARVGLEGYETDGIDMQNKRRVIRLIENRGVRPAKSSLRDNTLVIGIRTDREHLRDRVERRVDAMLGAGLEDEVSRLAQRYGWGAEPMKGIGYREWLPFFEPQPGLKQDLAQTRQRIINATMGLAKRQRTWFKRNDWIHWVTPPNTEAESVDLVTTFLANDHLG